jgi:hypothetical protein
VQNVPGSSLTLNVELSSYQVLIKKLMSIGWNRKELFIRLKITAFWDILCNHFPK